MVEIMLHINKSISTCVHNDPILQMSTFADYRRYGYLINIISSLFVVVL
jgi:hypothetical protein